MRCLWLLLVLSGCAHAPGGDDSTSGPGPASVPEPPPPDPDAPFLGGREMPLTPSRLILAWGPGPRPVLETLPGGRLLPYTEGRRPETERDRPGLALRPGWKIVHEVPSDEVIFELDPIDGTLRDPTSPDQTMACRLTHGGELRCTCDGHRPLRELRFSVHGDALVGGRRWATRTVALLEPAPEGHLEVLRSLFLYAQILVDEDTESHDGDSGVFGAH